MATGSNISDVELLKIKETTIPWACPHFRYTNNKSRLLRDYRLLYSFYVTCTRKNSSKRKANDCKCRVENCETNRTRVHACLSCIYFGCFVDVKDSHISHHAQKENHYLAMNTDSGHIFCFKCNDYKYDVRLEKIAQQLSLRASRRKSKTSFGTYKWKPNAHELYFLKQHKHQVVYDSNTEIRGFVNIKNTICAFIAVAQALIHAPAFRDYLFSDKHRCKFKKSSSHCSICAMAEIAEECFSGESKPLLMINFLVFLKERAPSYAADTYHDSSYFYQNLVTLFCEDCEASSPVPNICSSIFEFSYSKEYKCNKCEKITESTSTVSSILLIPSVWSLLSDWKSYESNFIGCSNRCSEPDGILKITPLKLPYVLTFNLEQFDVSEYVSPVERKKKKKTVPNFILFKEFLYLSPESIMDKDKVDILENCDYLYYLFCVFEYIPEREHYVVHIRKHKNKWFRCDVENVEPETLETVLKIKARMLFYHKMYV